MTSIASTYELALAAPPKPAQPTEMALSAPSDAPDIDNPERGNVTMFGENGFEFSDLIDVINPLQHIPLVSTMYRENTGDEIGAVPRVAGATLFFGPIGLASSLFNVFVEQSTGKDMGEHVADWVLPDDGADTLAENAETQIPIAAGVPTDAGVDPVSAWARQEVAWAQSQANTWSKPVKSEVLKRSAPDAGPHVKDDHLAETSPVRLTEDARSAAWAYRAASALAETRIS